MKKYILTLVFLGLFLATAPSTAQTQSDFDDSGNAAGCAALPVNLRYGMRDTNANGNSVSVLQDFLYTQGYLSLQPTGFFGSLTRTAVITFQNKYGIQATPPGFVGPTTRAKIKEIDCSGTPTPTQPPQPISPLGAPVVTNVTSKAAPAWTIYAGETASIYGSGLNQMIVLIAGMAIEAHVSSDSYAEFSVPLGLSAGLVDIIALSRAGVQSSVYQVTVVAASSPTNPSLPAQPTISYLNPNSGEVGSQVTIYGSGFLTNGQVNWVNFGSVPLSAFSADGKTLSFTVPGSGGMKCGGVNPTCITSTAYSLTPGFYQVSVSNLNGMSNTVTFGLKGTYGMEVSKPSAEMASVLESMKILLQQLSEELRRSN